MGPDDMKREAKKGREAPRLVSSQAQPLGDGRGEQWEGWGSGDATALSFQRKRSGRRDGVKAAGETGARTAPPDARAGIAVSVTGSPFSWATRRCYVSLNRAAGWLGGDGGRRRGPGTGGPAQRVPVPGRE